MLVSVIDCNHPNFTVRISARGKGMELSVSR